MKGFTTIGFLLSAVLLSSVAVAQPRWHDRRGRDYDRTYQLDRRDGRWIELATPTPARNGTEYVMIGPRQGRFSQIRIVALTGRVNLRHVRVVFTDGSARNYRINETIGRHHAPAVTFRLETRRGIDQLQITTDPRSRGTYTVYGT
jgi:hypothetical protein